MFDKRNEEEHSSWMSFSDLYSGLMVIFIIISLGLAYNYKRMADDYKVNADKYDKIEAIQKLLSKLEDSELFFYNADCKRYEYKQDVQFESNSDIIPEADKKNLIRAGKEIQAIITQIPSDADVRIQIIVEGRAAKAPHHSSKLGDSPFAENLSYGRARSLVVLWEKNGIDLRTAKSNLYVAGIGFSGQCRYSGLKEELNRRFVIQIIPYIPELKRDSL